MILLTDPCRSTTSNMSNIFGGKRRHTLGRIRSRAVPICHRRCHRVLPVPISEDKLGPPTGDQLQNEIEKTTKLQRKQFREFRSSNGLGCSWQINAWGDKDRDGNNLINLCADSNLPPCSTFVLSTKSHSAWFSASIAEEATWGDVFRACDSCFRKLCENEVVTRRQAVVNLNEMSYGCYMIVLGDDYDKDEDDDV